jgi:nucleoside 2-deoxyribosyltransferase
MKVFYTANADMCLNKPANFKKAIKTLHDTVGEKNVYSPEKREIALVGNNDTEATKAVSKKEKQLKNSDVVVADITNGTAGVGYFISTALYLKKPTLVIQKKNDDSRGTTIHDSITQGKNRLLSYERYENDELESIIKKFLDEAKKKMDTKFILIISPEIDRYLEWTSSNRRKHKAQVVREAIEAKMEEDEEWQEQIAA